jgi:hypothetical protein
MTHPPAGAVQAPENAVQPTEQLRYATLLDWGTRAGLAVLLLSFAATVFGLVESHVPAARLPELWGLPVARFLELTGTPTGWGWLALVRRGDMAGLLGIAILAGSSVLCLLALVPLYRARGDRAFVAICLAEVAVVLLAASGWLAGGH